jgi:hypothetical protein
MAMDSNSVETASTTILREIFAEESGEVFAVGFDEGATEDLIEILMELDEPPRVRLVARESVLKWVRGDDPINWIHDEVLPETVC